MTSMRYLAAAAAVLAIAVTAFIAADRREPAPDLSYTLLDGSRHATTELRGKVVLVNFWATSCVTCIKEMPDLAATHDRFVTRGYETLAVAMSYDRPDYVNHFAATRRLPFRFTHDEDGSLARGFGDVRLTPTTVVLDRQGRVVERIVGEPDFNALHALIDKLLAET